MKENCRVNVPIKFNCWKHHVGFIKKQISSLDKEEENKQLKKFLLLIGRSQMDLYFGEYSPKKISSLIILELKSKNSFDYDSYKVWLKSEGHNYRLLKLSDDSVWTLRLGEEPERYVHIHPGRYSKHSVRVKSTTLKTAICILCWQKLFPKIVVDLNLINVLRNEFVFAPPLKTLKHSAGLNRLLNLFNPV